MERNSPPTERVTRVLEVLSTSAAGRHTVSELARQTGISKPTCIGIVRELTRAEYLDYEPIGRTYGLGAALIALGRAAQERLSPLDSARPAMQRLSEQFHVACTASLIGDDHLTIVERTGPPSVFDPLIQIGQRLPLLPPTGKIAAVWRSDEQLNRWLDQWRAMVSPDDLRQFGEMVERCRRNSYHVEPFGDGYHRLAKLLSTLPAQTLSQDVVAVVAQVASAFSQADLTPFELRQGERYSVSTISSPTFSVTGHVALVLVLYVCRESVRFDEVKRYGDALASVGHEITAAMSGRNPWQDL